MRKLFLHIGLPKTATTTVQYEILSHAANRGIYLGKFEGNPGSFHKLISDYLNGTCARDTARLRVEELLKDRPIALYSNEMLSVDSAMCWREKIAKLGALLQGIDCTLLVTRRKPSQHAPSLYAELQPTSGWRDFDAFLQDPQSDILNPAILNQVLVAAGFGAPNQICYIDFDSLVRSRFTILQSHIPGLFIPDSPQQRNTRMRRGDAIISRAIGAHDVARALARHLGLLQLTPVRLRKTLGALLRHVPLSWHKTIDVPGDHSALDALDREYDAASGRARL